MTYGLKNRYLWKALQGSFRTHEGLKPMCPCDQREVVGFEATSFTVSPD
jgi:hypothetical protein